MATYNVTSAPYNATGNGTTDDTAAMQAAIDAAATAGGGTVYVPKGVYIVANLALKTNVIMFGDGSGSVLKLKNSTTADVIKSAGSLASPIFNATLQDLRIDGNKANQSSGVSLQQYGINLDGAQSCRIRRCYIHDTQRSGVYIHGANNMAEDNLLWGIGKVGASGSIIGRSGIVADASSPNTVLRNNRVDDCLEHGLKIYNNNDYSVVEGNLIKAAADRGIYVAENDGTVIANNTVNGASVVGIFVGEGGAPGTRCAVTGNTVHGILLGTSGGHGILIQNQDWTACTGNSVTDCVGTGIYLLDSDWGTVVGNVSRGNGTNLNSTGGTSANNTVGNNAI